MKTSAIISIVLIGISALAFAAKEKQATESKTFDPGQFYGLIVNNNSNIILTQGEKNSLTIEGDQKTIQNTHTTIQNGALVITGNGDERPNIYVTVKELNMIEITGGAKIYAMGTISSDILLLKVNGTGSMKLDVKSLKVAMIVKGEGKIVVSGSTGESYERQYGNGKIYDGDLYAYSQTIDQVGTTNE
jgi:hypothetical protein